MCFLFRIDICALKMAPPTPASTAVASTVVTPDTNAGLCQSEYLKVTGSTSLFHVSSIFFVTSSHNVLRYIALQIICFIIDKRIIHKTKNN